MIARAVNEHNFTGHLVIITDGQVDKSEIANCATMLGSRKFSQVDCYLINTGGAIEESVGAPFQWGSPVRTVRYDPCTACSGSKMCLDHHYRVREITAPTSEHLDVHRRITTITTPEEFLGSFEELKCLIVTRNLGRPTRDNELHDALVALQSRFFGTVLRSFDHELSLSFHNAVRSCDPTQIIAAMRKIHETPAPIFPWSVPLAQLISFADCGLAGETSSDAARAKKAAPVASAPPTRSGENEDEPTQPLKSTCPITLEELTTGNTFLPVKPGPPLLSILTDPDDVLNSPFNALRDPSLLAALIKRLDKPVSCNGYLAAGPDGLPFSPETRAELMTNGVLVFASTDAAVRTTDWTLWRMLNHGKRAGRATSWVALLWYLVASGQIPYLESIEEAIRGHLLYRLHNRESDFTTLSLSGSKNHQLLMAPTACAIVWILFAGAVLRLPTEKDPLRLHMAAIPILLKLLELLGISLPPECEQHILRTRVLLDMLRVVAQKEVTLPQMKRHIRALFQKSVRMSAGDYILLDGPAAADVSAILADLPPLWQGLSKEWLWTLVCLINPNNLAPGNLPNLFEPAPAPPVISVWTNITIRLPVKPHPRTCRPLTLDETHIGAVVGIAYPTHVGKIFSTDELFAQFVETHNRLPRDLHELLTFFASKSETLPAAVIQFAESVLADYVPFIRALGAAKFLQVRGVVAISANDATVFDYGICRFIARRAASVSRLKDKVDPKTGNIQQHQRAKIESGAAPCADP